MQNLIKFVWDPIEPENIFNQIRSNDNGAIVAFIGTVRKISNEGNIVTHLKIQPAGKDAEKKLQDITNEISHKWPIKVESVAIYRRIGTLAVGEIALVVAVTSIHRQEAFDACEYIVNRIKQGDITIEKDINIAES